MTCQPRISGLPENLNNLNNFEWRSSCNPKIMILRTFYSAAYNAMAVFFMQAK
jgi:hypothetical protein